LGAIKAKGLNRRAKIG